MALYKFCIVLYCIVRFRLIIDNFFPDKRTHCGVSVLGGRTLMTTVYERPDQQVMDPSWTERPFHSLSTIRYDTRCYFNVRSKDNTSRLDYDYAQQRLDQSGLRAVSQSRRYKCKSDTRTHHDARIRQWRRQGEGGKLPPYGWTSKNYVICVCFHCHGTSS